MSEPTNITRKAISGAVWSYLTFGLGKVLVLISTGILARLLTPSEFGIVGFATVAMTYLSIVKDLGLSSALIQRRDNLEAVSQSVFTWNLLMAILLTAVCFIGAPSIATYFAEPLVSPILRLLSTTFILSALGTVNSARLSRALNYRKKMMPELAQVITKGGVGIGLALAGYGVWSLVIAQIVSTVVWLIVIFFVSPWRPRLNFDLLLASELMEFGFSIIGISAFGVITNNIDYLIVGRVLGSASLGVYTLAYRLPELFVFQLLWVLTGVSFSAYSVIQSDIPKLRYGFLSSTRYVEMILVPICIGLMLLAEPIVFTLFGNQWGEAIPLVRILAISGFFSSIAFHVGGVYKAIGRPNIIVTISMFKLLVLIPVMIVGTRFGLVGIAFAHLVVSILFMFVRIGVANQVLNISSYRIFSQLRPSLIAGIPLAICILLVGQIMPFNLPIIQLALPTVLGGLCYLAALWSQEADTLTRLYKRIGLPMTIGRFT